LQKYCKLTVFKMAAVRHLGFLKFKFFNRYERYHTIFRKDQSHRCRDITIFVIFKMVATAVSDFQKFKILTVCQLLGANTRHRAKFHQNRSNGCRDIAI